MIKILVAIGVLCYVLKLSGFCFNQFGWKTDRELIKAAFRHEQAGGWSNTPAVSDIESYLQEFPRCCTVSGSDPLMSGPFLNGLFGRRFYAVSIKYPVTVINEDGEPYYKSILIMDCCGQSIPDSYGIGSSLPVPPGLAPKLPERTKGPTD